MRHATVWALQRRHRAPRRGGHSFNAIHCVDRNDRHTTAKKAFMATEDIRVTHPVEIKADSEARVAFDLMQFIASREQVAEEQKRTREHWLKLYLQCRAAAREANLERVLTLK